MSKTIKVKRKDYISASQINSFIDDRPGYIDKYIMGAGWESNAYFGRGNAIEAALDAIIGGMDFNSAEDFAWNFYVEYGIKEKLSEREIAKVSEDHIRKMVRAIGHFYMNDLGATTAVERQKKFVLKMDGVDQDILGYMDYVFPSTNPLSRGRVRDLKGASKTPSKLSDKYKLQGTVYHLATGCPVTFDHVFVLKAGPKVVSIDLSPEDIIEYTPIIKAYANHIKQLWSIVPDEIDEDYMDAFKALSAPNIFGIWSADEKAAAIKKITNQ